METIKSLYESLSIYYALFVCNAENVSSMITQLKTHGYPATRWEFGKDYQHHARLLVLTPQEALDSFLEWTDVTLVMCETSHIFDQILKHDLAKHKTIVEINCAL